MIFEDKKITLKDGRTAILKTPCIEDAEKMLKYIKKSCGETDYLTRYPEEWDSVSVESEEKWVKNLRESQSTLPKVRHFWRCIFLCQKSRKSTRQNSNFVL